MSIESGSDEGSFPDPYISVSSHGGWNERTSLNLSYKDAKPFMRTLPSGPDHP